MKKKYHYDGPIISFGKIIDNKWSADTYAVTAKQAMNNFKYQANIKMGRVKNNKISLPGQILEE